MYTMGGVCSIMLIGDIPTIYLIYARKERKNEAKTKSCNAESTGIFKSLVQLFFQNTLA